MLAELGMADAQPVPGPIKFRFQARGGLKRLDRLIQVPLFVASESQIEMHLRIVRFEAQCFPKVSGRCSEISPIGVNECHGFGGTRVVGCGQQCLAILFHRRVIFAEELEKTCAQEVLPFLKIHLDIPLLITVPILRIALPRRKYYRREVLKSGFVHYGIDTMSSPELFIVSVLKALVEIAAMALLAQGLIGLLSGKAKQNNFVYRLFQVVTAPIYKAVRAITPKFVADRHIGLACFFILFWMWIALIYAKAYVCHAQNLACFAN